MGTVSRKLPLFLLLLIPITVFIDIMSFANGQTCTAKGFACINCTVAQLCSTGTPTGPLITCPSGTICRTTSDFECTLGTTCFTCSLAGRYPDPYSTSRYYICSNNAAGGLDTIVVSCPTGFSFDPITSICVASTTTTTTVSTTTAIYPCVAPGRFPDPTNCSNYFMCQTNTATTYYVYKYTCPPTTLFSSTTKTCTSASVAGCTTATG